MLDIFDVKASDFNEAIEEASGKSAGNGTDYRPSLSNDLPVYAARLRFLPNPVDPRRSVVSKYGYYLPDVVTGRVRWYDCPSNSGDRRAKNIITTAFFETRDSQSAQIKRISKTFSRKQYHFMLAYVMLDKNQADTVGKVMVMRYAKQVHDMMKNQTLGDPGVGVAPCTFYSPIEGRDFILKIEKKKIGEGNQQITSYEGSMFASDRTPFGFAEEGFPRMNSPEDREKLLDLMKTAPILAEKEYQPWTPEQEQEVIAIVRNEVDNEALFARIYKKTYGASATVPPLEVSTQDVNVEEMEMDNDSSSIIDELTGGASSVTEEVKVTPSNEPAELVDTTPAAVDDTDDTGGDEVDGLDDLDLDELEGL